MKVQNWNNSAYVTYIAIALIYEGVPSLSFVWRALIHPPPIKKRGKAAFGSMVSHIDNITYFLAFGNILFVFRQASVCCRRSVFADRDFGNDILLNIIFTRLSPSVYPPDPLKTEEYSAAEFLLADPFPASGYSWRTVHEA